MIAVVEISGADSIAAALRFAELHPAHALLPTYVSTGTEFGSFEAIEGNLAFLGDELRRRTGSELLDVEVSGRPELWRAINGRYATVIDQRFGTWLPCVGCHLYLHLMRIPVCLSHGAHVVVSGEREQHGNRTKANQAPDALNAYADVLAHAGIELALPLREVAEESEVDAILGERWPGGSPQLECVLSGNERDLSGASCRRAPDTLLEDFLVPVGRLLADELAHGGEDWLGIVERVLQGQA